jgi:hypothetical protein
MIELNPQYRTVNTIVKNAFGFRSPHPGEPGIVEMLPHLVHLTLEVLFLHVAQVECDQVEQPLPLRIRQLRSVNSGIVKNSVVLEGFSEAVVASLRRLQNRFVALL